jgi:hypothetical protein
MNRLSMRFAPEHLVVRRYEPGFDLRGRLLSVAGFETDIVEELQRDAGAGGRVAAF